MITQGFIETGLNAIRDALLAAADRAGLTLAETHVTHHAARRFRSTVRQLETLLRRLIVLIAAGLDLAPEPPRAPHHTDPVILAKAGPSGRESGHPDTPRPKTPRPYHFALTPKAGFDPDKLIALRERQKAGLAQSYRNCTGIRPLLDRFQTLMRHLDKPERLARRMARHLARLRAAGEPRPICPPPQHTHRLGHELGVIADYLPFAIGDALAGWYDTS
ncbi:hypothetical protein D1227_13460 [Henriciella mobilis]|uniref:hypothetical protein n=1 Tax=Henriciella mobilis TaxID=2305467 RepID=UPI000E669224|nr:hypothetical protein [Henriciella mobilis]RIJ15082.1 hypothetical protein D1231_13650 [Henriciella mobilis]RIJ20252.1 hypothetical protein D1227_13460 [Henriciella mobilis]